MEPSAMRGTVVASIVESGFAANMPMEVSIVRSSRPVFG
jgi:hypothetical protein